MSNSNRFKLSDSLVDSPQLVNAGGAVGRALAGRLWNSTGRHPCVFLDGLWLKRSWGGEVQNVSVPEREAGSQHHRRAG
jgi:hypothetical protein